MFLSLRTRILLISGIVLLVFISALYLNSRAILLQSFDQFEVEHVEEDVQRTLNTVQDNLDGLSATNRDYSNWDDTYAFVEDGNQAYIDSNMIDDTLTGLDLDFMIFLDNNNSVVYSKTVNLSDAQTELLSDTLMSTPALLLHPSVESAVTGVWMVGQDAVLVSSRPILTSANEGPIHGTLVIGKLLNEERIQHLSDSLRFSISLQNVHAADLPIKQSEFSASKPIVVQPLNDKTVAGYGLVTDIDQNPVFVLTVQRPRDIHAQGMTSLSYILSSMVIIGLVFLGITLTLLERMVLSRLSNLNKQVSQIAISSSPSARVSTSGNDELSSLAEAINKMLDALAQAQQQLHQINHELEDRVWERTVELAHARDQALESLRLKGRILANVSHDARTPLNIISLRTEMLQSGRYGDVTPKQVEVLDGILESSQQLLSFMNNLLEEARFDRKQVTIAESEFGLNQFMEEVLGSVRPLADKKGLGIRSEIAPDLPPSIVSDPNRLKQVLTNLLDNAIKFTNQGLITVKLRRVDGKQWEIQVSDSGIGIPTEAQSHIFEAFWQVDGTITREANRGVGLGLSIVKQLVSLMKGTVVVESEPGHGSTFKIVLPLKTVGEVEVHEPT